MISQTPDKAIRSGREAFLSALKNSRGLGHDSHYPNVLIIAVK